WGASWSAGRRSSSSSRGGPMEPTSSSPTPPAGGGPSGSSAAWAATLASSTSRAKRRPAAYAAWCSRTSVGPRSGPPGRERRRRSEGPDATDGSSSPRRPLHDAVRTTSEPRLVARVNRTGGRPRPTAEPRPAGYNGGEEALFSAHEGLGRARAHG